MTNHVFSQVLWEPQGFHRVKRFLVLYVALFLPVLLLTPRLFRPLAIALAITATAIAVGPGAVLSVMLFFYSATVIGNIAFYRSEVEGEDSLLALLLGTSILIALEEVLVRLPWNYPWVYIIVLLLPVAFAPRLAWLTLRKAVSLFRGFSLNSLAERAAAGVLTMVLMADWLMSLEPDISADGLARDS